MSAAGEAKAGTARRRAIERRPTGVPVKIHGTAGGRE
jgi:hypothetical protein